MFAIGVSTRDVSAGIKSHMMRRRSCTERQFCWAAQESPMSHAHRRGDAAFLQALLRLRLRRRVVHRNARFDHGLPVASAQAADFRAERETLDRKILGLFPIAAEDFDLGLILQ